MKQWGSVTGRPYGLVAYFAECLHRKGEALSSSPSQATYFLSINELPHGKTNNLHMRKQRRRSASQ